MTHALQACYDRLYPHMTAGHAAIMLVDTCTEPPTKTTWGNWPGNGGPTSDIRTNYWRDTWTATKYPFLFCHAIDATEEANLMTLVAVHHDWTTNYNCASFASETFHSVTGIDIDADEFLGYETPREIGQHIIIANHGTRRPIPMPF